jgi:hypothetical protein
MDTEEIMAQLKNVMDLVEQIDKLMAVCAGVISLQLEDFDSESWRDLQGCMEVNIGLLKMQRQAITLGSKAIGNEALTSHLEIVLLAE